MTVIAGMQPLTIERVPPSADNLRQLSILRTVVFREWPYLYDADSTYEEGYLQDFLGSANATVVVARVGDIYVGMATASPLSSQPLALTAPLRQAGIAIDQCFYFGESVLLPQFRGIGGGHRFFDEREQAARAAGAAAAIFCAVIREDDHPLRPADPRDLSPFWRSRGYRPLGIRCQMEWKEVGRVSDCSHMMQFWMKSL